MRSVARKKSVSICRFVVVVACHFTLCAFCLLSRICSLLRLLLFLSLFLVLSLYRYIVLSRVSFNSADVPIDENGVNKTKNTEWIQIFQIFGWYDCKHNTQSNASNNVPCAVACNVRIWDISFKAITMRYIPVLYQRVRAYALSNDIVVTTIHWQIASQSHYFQCIQTHTQTHTHIKFTLCTFRLNTRRTMKQKRKSNKLTN